MNKNIILLSDGTGNGAAKRNKTNVWRLYDALDTASRRPDRFLRPMVSVRRSFCRSNLLAAPLAGD